MKIKKYSKKERSKEIQFLDEIEKQLKLEHDIREKTLEAIREENRDVIQVLEDIIKLEDLKCIKYRSLNLLNNFA